MLGGCFLLLTAQRQPLLVDHFAVQHSVPDTLPGNGTQVMVLLGDFCP